MAEPPTRTAGVGTGLVLGPRLAVGGMGEIHRATLEVEGRRVDCVVKTLLPGVGELERALFLREARALAALTRLPARRFAHLLAHDPERLVLEHIDGVDLSTLLLHRRRRGKPLAVGAVVALGIGLCEALLELITAHEDGRPLGLVHRDLHPGNVLVGRDGGVKVIDLGVATFVALEQTSANPRGTLAYMAPEQLREGRVSAQSDLYAVGLMLWEALVGQPARPPGEGSLGELLAFRHTVPTAPAMFSALPDELVAVVSAMLAVEPGARPSVDEVLGVLRRLEGAADELARVVVPLVEAGVVVRAAPTLAGRAGVGGAGVGDGVGVGVSGADEGVAGGVGVSGAGVGVGVSGAGVEAAGGEGRRRPGRMWVGVGAVVMLGVGAFAVGAGSGGAAPTGSSAVRSSELANAGGEGVGTAQGTGPTTTAARALESDVVALGEVGPLPTQPRSTELANADVVGAGPTSGLAGTATDPRSTVLYNAEVVGAEVVAPEVVGPEVVGAEVAVPTASADGRKPATTDASSPSDSTAPQPATPEANRAGPTFTITSQDGPLHVSGLGTSDLAPQTTTALPPEGAGLLRLTGGSPPLTALVRIVRRDNNATATVGAPPGELYEVSCQGRPPRPTPVAGLSLDTALTCRITADGGRALAFTLRPQPPR